MNKKGKIYLTLIILALLAIVALEYTKPQAVNWFPSYAKQHKIPFGTFILHEQLNNLFSNEQIVTIEEPAYTYINSDDSFVGTYLFINNDIQFDDAELESLLQWTEKGNTLFVASESMNKKLLDTLNLETSVLSNFNNIENIYQLKLKNKRLSKENLYSVDKADFISYFKKIDTLNTSVIGVIQNETKDDTINTKEYVNIIKQPFGNGTIILSTFPQAFTNYFLLTPPNQNFTAGLLSYINTKNPIYVDAYYKSGKTFFSSPLYVLLNNKPLKWAYYTMLIGVFIYVIFEGKRKQRAIPVVKPLDNKTLDFTRTIANMYYEKQNHLDIAKLKIQYFLDFIRTHLHLNTNTIDDVFLKNLAARSNNTLKDTETLFKTIETINKKHILTEKELESLSSLIETYKSNNSWTIKT